MGKKKLIIVNGTMCVGKTEVCKRLYRKIENSVWLDGDWCWTMNPFIVNEENKKMVENNIVYLLRSFLENSTIENVIFNWVIHQENIFDLLLNRLKDLDFELYKITLMCSADAMKERVLKRTEEGEDFEENLKACIERLPLYQNMNTIKIDTSNITLVETVDKVIEIIR